MTKPKALEPGHSIGVIAPASAPDSLDRFHEGCNHVEERGYRLVRGRTTYAPHGYLSGRDRERLTELNEMLARSDISALFCARGGYGTLRLLSDIDYAAARRFPKLVVGYSDITALQLALYAKTGLPSISGPMLTPDWSDLDPELEEHFWRIAAGRIPYSVPLPNDHRASPIQEGHAEGILIGGNLTLLTRLLGTPFFPSIDGAILFVEDIGEPPYRIDGMLAQLRLAGVFDRIGGMIFGKFTDSDPEPDRPSLSMEEVLEGYSRFIPGPVVTDFPHGHGQPSVSLPIGVKARLLATDRNLEVTLLESVVD